MTQNNLDFYVHPSAWIDARVSIGPKTKIWHGVHVMEEANIGSHCVLGHSVFIGPHVVLGHGCRVQNHVSLFEGVHCEDFVFIGPGAMFTNVKHPRAHLSRRDAFEQTWVEHHATIGARAVIVCGVRIGHHAMIGAGAVVTKDVEPHAIVVGNPAHRIGWACECGETLVSLENDHYRCPRCHQLWHFPPKIGE